MNVAEWRKGVPAEALYWDSWLGTRGRAWAADVAAAEREFVERFDPRTEFDPHLRELIQSTVDPVRVLDVGAGPATCLGTQWPGRRIEITPIDALGGTYGDMLAVHGLKAPVRTVCCQGEELHQRFAAEYFDMAYARNSLDHAYDPFLIIGNMLRVVKPGGVVYLLHHIREADTQRRQGLHQWNFWPHELGFYVLEDAATGDKRFLDAARMTMTTIGNDVEVVIWK